MALSTNRTLITQTGINTHQVLNVGGLDSAGIATFSNFKTGESNVHSIGFDVVSSAGAGATIRSTGNASFSGIVTAQKFVGDISDATGAAAGLGTALSQTQTDPLNKIYYTDKVLSISTTQTIDHPATANLAYTQYGDIKIEDGHDLIVKDGDDFKYDILGISTTKIFDIVGNVTGDVHGNINNSTLLLKTGGSERLRIDSEGKFYFGNQTVLDPANNNTVGLSGSGVLGFMSISRNSDVPFIIGRTGTDGALARFYHAGTLDGFIQTNSGRLELYANTDLVLGSSNGTERLRIKSDGGFRAENTDSNAVHAISNYDHGNNNYTHRNNRVLTSNGTGWDGNESTDGADPILILSVADRAGNSDIGDAYGLCLHSESQDNNDYGPVIGWSNRSASGSYNTTYAAIVGQKTGTAADNNWSSGALHFFTQKPGGYMDNVADMTIDQSGHVMMPRNSRFFALNNTGTSDTSNGGTGLISNEFESELVDSNGDFDGSNGRFTAPVDGAYEFHFAALHRALSNSGSGELSFYKNGANLSQRSFGYSNIGSGGSNNDHQHLHVHGIFSLSAGDYVDVRVYAQSSGMDFYFYQGLGYFSGKLLG